MKKLLVILFITVSYFGFSQDSNAFKSIKETSIEATKSNKSILLVFTESAKDYKYIADKLSGLSATFVMHHVDRAENNGLTQEQNMLNQRLVTHYNKTNTYPSVYVLDKHASRTGESLLNLSEAEITKFSESLKAH
ncbi:hypothetical protein [Winogradskyella sp. 3972H.M.0a.05]|uniref:hypothetical protein n=1 Tax=Winogradskyella sp. 3972H.M.0a.05 TaxID=2950277 RepID=UPI00339A0FD4